MAKKKKLTIIHVKSKRKTAKARAYAKKGSGVVRINKIPINIIQPKYVRMLIEEPLLLAKEVNENYGKDVDIDVIVEGGGFMGQALASRSCIAKALYQYYGDENLKEKFLSYDRFLLVDDVRRKEAKKQLGRGARAKRQHTKR